MPQPNITHCSLCESNKCCGIEIPGRSQFRRHLLEAEIDRSQEAQGANRHHTFVIKMQTSAIALGEGHLERKDSLTGQLRGQLKPSVMMNAYNPSTEEAKAPSAIQPVQGQPGLMRYPSKNENKHHFYFRANMASTRGQLKW